MNEWQSLLPDYDRFSYYAGMTYAFSEIVAAGVKPLALSPPYTPEDAKQMAKPTELIAAEFGVLTLVEPELLTTLLFPAAISSGRVVILMAKEQETLNKYLELKQQRADVGNEQYFPEFEDRLAWSFGRLLGYSDEAIMRMLG